MGLIRVLIVDDSPFFRRRIHERLEASGEVQVAGEATNGQEAVEMAASLRPDLITMDVAMPVLDGISAVRRIMREHPTDIIMLSALTREGARATLEALEAGAVDFLPKHTGLRDGAGTADGYDLCSRIISIARRRRGRQRDELAVAPRPLVRRPERRRTAPRLVVIGASTGGPVAVQKVLTGLAANYPCPLLVAVHMPAEFTASFAERLDSVCRLEVAEAADGDALRPGRALIAPGGVQTLIEERSGRPRVRLMPGGEQLYRPSIDITFGSAARALGDAVQALVLTGMGADGTEGARLLKERGAAVWSQDQASSVVYGMPYAVAKAGYSDRVLALDDIGAALAELA